MENNLKTISIALDWTPNINHIGIFIAQELGFYKEKGLNVEIISPLDDNYQMTPGKKLERGIADFSIAPFETVISLNNKKNVVDAIAVFAILQEDVSSIATLKSSGIDRPKLLDNKMYASYKARYEDHIVIQMVKNDGGEGSINIQYPEKLGIWNTLLEDEADATWIFNNWEGVEAKSKNIELNTFSLSDFGIPYGYSPVILTKKTSLNACKTEYTAFVESTKKGYLYATEHPQKAVDILKNHLTDEDQKNINIMDTLKFTAPFFGDSDSCGKMKPERVQSFLEWLVQNKIENSQILEQNLYTNELVQ